MLLSPNLQMTHQFTGTATTCDGDSAECDMDHVTIFGFAVCDDCGHGRECVHPPWDKIVETCAAHSRPPAKALRHG